MGVSVYWTQNVMCVFVCVFSVISNQSTSKKPLLSDLKVSKYRKLRIWSHLLKKF